MLEKHLIWISIFILDISDGLQVKYLAYSGGQLISQVSSIYGKPGEANCSINKTKAKKRRFYSHG